MQGAAILSVQNFSTISATLHGSVSNSPVLGGQPAAEAGGLKHGVWQGWWTLFLFGKICRQRGWPCGGYGRGCLGPGLHQRWGPGGLGANCTAHGGQI
eukprot:1123123-Pelagomonas_calceolata.AAC.1